MFRKFSIQWINKHTLKTYFNYVMYSIWSEFLLKSEKWFFVFANNFAYFSPFNNSTFERNFEKSKLVFFKRLFQVLLESFFGRWRRNYLMRSVHKIIVLSYLLMEYKCNGWKLNIDVEPWHITIFKCPFTYTKGWHDMLLFFIQHFTIIWRF